jgi:hypothetical protein
MSREVIQDFLNLAGVVGISLTNRRMRPYFYGLDSVSDRTKQALGQGVLQVVENVPEGFESFDFYFADHVVFIYKLTHGLVLVVLTEKSIKMVDYSQGITKIKHLIDTDTYNTVSYFKLLLGSVTQHSLPGTNWHASQPTTVTQTTDQDRSATQISVNSNPSDAIATSAKSANAIAETDNQANNSTNTRASTTASNANIRASTTARTVNVNTQAITTNKSQTPPTSASTSATSAPTARAVASNKPTDVTDSSSKLVSAKTDLEEYKLDELLDALNKLSNFTTQYLGKVVVTNYWKSSRPTSTWLAEFEIDRNGQVSHPKQTAISFNNEELQQIQLWVAAYIKRCKLVIRNFDQMLEQDCLDSRQKQILF